MSDIANLESAYEMIEQVSELVGKAEKGKEMIGEIRTLIFCTQKSATHKIQPKNPLFYLEKPII